MCFTLQCTLSQAVYASWTERHLNHSCLSFNILDGTKKKLSTLTSCHNPSELPQPGGYGLTMCYSVPPVTQQGNERESGLAVFLQSMVYHLRHGADQVVIYVVREGRDKVLHLLRPFIARKVVTVVLVIMVLVVVLVAIVVVAMPTE